MLKQKNIMKIIYIVSWAIAILNAFTSFEKGLSSGAIGWITATLWLTILIIKEYE